jgi:catecholate siderophore receptor
MNLNFNFIFSGRAKGMDRSARRYLGLLAVGLVSVWAPAQALAQADPAAEARTRTVSGTVVDSTGGVMVGAKVSLEGAPAGRRETVTDAAGRFTFEDVPATPVRLTVKLPRFALASLDVDGPAGGVQVVLQPLPVSEQVTVREAGPVPSHIATATRTDTLLRDVPQAVTVVNKSVIADQKMQGIGDVVRYVPGIGIAQGEGNRDTPIFRGNSSTSDFYVDGIRDDIQFFRDLYNVERVEALKGPNGMIFGRGGVGGVINRVTRQADLAAAPREVAVQLGSWGNRRVSVDLGRSASARAAFRVTGVYENSDSYREDFGLERYGVNPTVAFAIGANTTLRAGYEHFHDARTADRGIPSFQGRPVATGVSTFFGDPDRSESVVTVDVVSAALEHRFGHGVVLRNRTSYGDYEKFYQNVFPGAVNAAGSLVSISGYNNGTERRNLFSQTDLVVARRALGLEHTLLAGMELGRQENDNLRTTAFFPTIGPTATSVSVPLASPRTSLPLAFRPGATDADNHGVANVFALYVQDQVTLFRRLQAIAGVRYDMFEMDLTNNRTQARFASKDNLVSPRLGLVYKPAAQASVYASYTLSYLPRAGEQLSSLSLTNQALDPEKFRNCEVGAKWDLARGLALTAAAYQLDRTNVIVPDPADPTRSLLVDGQRTRGVELSLGGHVTSAWSVLGAYAYQDGEITRSLSATAQAGAVLAQLPSHSLSLWNRYDFSPRAGAGLGLVHRGEVFTSTDNTVVLPAFTRLDAAVFVSITSKLRAQVNVENLLDTEYFPHAHSNNNITPGSPRALRVGLTAGF